MSPKFPLSSIHGNLLTGTDGRMWAIWRLTGLSYGMAPTKQKQAYMAAHAALARQLRGEALLMGLCATTDPVDLVERMVHGVDLEKNPDLATEALARLDELQTGALSTMALGKRRFYLAVPLANSGLDGVLAPLGAAVTGIKDALGWPRSAPALTSLTARREQADRVRDALPPAFEATDATYSDIEFIFSRAISRGALAEFEPQDDGSPLATLRGAPAQMLPRAMTDEGARSDEAGEGGLGKLRAQIMHNPLAHRVLKVWDEREKPSYQVLCAVAGIPNRDLPFPGTEWVGRIDEKQPDVDWAQRIRVHSNLDTQRRNARTLNDLEDQVSHRSSGDGARSTQVGMSEVLAAAEEFAEIIANDSNEVELHVTTIFAVSGPDQKTATQRAQALVTAFERESFRVIREPGQQANLWASMLPCTPELAAVRSLAESTTSTGWAQSMPLISHRLGDQTGLALAVSAGQVVLLDEEQIKARSTSLAVAFCGNLGAGKSVGLKVFALGMLARSRHAQCMAIDRSHTREWALALSHDDLVEVQCGNGADVSIDPLRLLPPAEATDAALTFLTVLLNIHPTSTLGVLLSEVLEQEYRQERELGSLKAVAEHLLGREDEPAKELGGKMRVFARRASAAAVFDDQLVPLDLTARRIVFLTSALDLPSDDELANQRRFDQMSVAKIYGRAMYALIMALIKRQCFQDPRYPGICVTDEVHALNKSPECTQLVNEFIRDSRKHNAWLLEGSHDAEADFGDETQRGLIGMRVLMRHTDPNLARKALLWMGFDLEKDPFEELVDLVAGLSPAGDPARAGEAIIRDFSGQVDVARVLLPAHPETRQRVLTTPPADDERVAPRKRRRSTIAAVRS